MLKLPFQALEFEEFGSYKVGKSIYKTSREIVQTL